jgi:hypothetical protein
VQQAKPVHQDIKVLKDHKDHKAELGFQVHLVFKDLKAFKAHKAH